MATVHSNSGRREAEEPLHYEDRAIPPRDFRMVATCAAGEFSSPMLPLNIAQRDREAWAWRLAVAARRVAGGSVPSGVQVLSLNTYRVLR